jgi:hypothetical protein
MPSGTGTVFGGRCDKNALFSPSELVLIARILIASSTRFHKFHTLCSVKYEMDNSTISTPTTLLMHAARQAGVLLHI